MTVGKNVAVLGGAVPLSLRTKMRGLEKKEGSFFSTRGNDFNTQAGRKAFENMKKHTMSSIHSKFNV